MLSEDQIKFEIVKYSMENLNSIYKQFCFEDCDEKEEKRLIKSAVTMPANWIKMDEDNIKDRFSTLKDFDYTLYYPGEIEVSFDCEPLDDQLRAYVYLDFGKEKIQSIIISGE